ncbi:MAG: GAF domain-containing sensor histidine kinase [Anaerolineae bacterium]|nr:GAF domain-containing sensor histidine kinase [Anaerolineae bacterium]
MRKKWGDLTVPVDKLTAILEITSAISSTLTLDEILARFTEKMTRLVGADGCTLFRCQPEAEALVVLADYVSPEVQTPFDDVSHLGAKYPLQHYPITAQVLQQQTPQTIYRDNPHADEAQTGLLDAFHWSGVLMVPLVCQGKAIGLLSLYLADRQHRFTEDEVSLCQGLAGQVAVAIENDRLYHEADEGQLIAEAMQVIGRALASELDYHRIVRDVADFAFRLVDAQLVEVVVPEAIKFRLVAASGRDPRAASHSDDISPDSWEYGPLVRAGQEKRPIVIDDIHPNSGLAQTDEPAERPGWRSMVAVPLLSRSRLVGVLAAYARRPNFFKADDVAVLMSLASQAAVAIQNAQLFTELEAQRQALQLVSLRLVSAQEEERRRISRELHDELGQALTALKINLDVARRSLPTDSPDKLVQSVAEASSLAVHTLEAARHLSLELHPAILDDLGLIAALRWEIDRFEQRTGQAVHFKVDLGEITIQPELQITIYRIVTEALTNAARHSQADHIAVQLQLQGRQVVLSIEDNGVGFDAAAWFSSPAERKSLGLVGMRERAELLGGQLEVISKPGEGTKVWVQLPLND